MKQRCHLTLLAIFFLSCTLLLTACNRHQSTDANNNSDSDIGTDLPILTQTQISTTINALVQKFPENTTMGIMVQDLNNGKILYELNPTRSFVPASVMKILTATTALNYLGPSFRFNTILAIDKPIVAGVATGNIYLSFSGDPTLKSSELSALLSVLTQKNVRQIKGNVVIDPSPFVAEQTGPGFMSDDENICFAALSNGIILDKNCFKFSLYPNPKINSPAILISKHSLSFTPINNSVTTALSDNDDCEQTLVSYPDNHYELSGCMPYNHREQLFNVAISNPNQYAADYINAILQQQHIQLNGKIIFGQRPAKLTVLATHQSQPLSHLIKHMLKKSDNLYANTLFKTVGAVYFDSAANWKNGADAMLAILTQMHIDTSFDILVDGAGLSRYNRLTPKTLLDAFNVTYQQPQLSHIFLKSLAASGGTGTLKYFTLDRADAKFFGKTGSMKNVKGLAGVLTRAGKPYLLFVMLVNGSSPGKNYTQLSNQILNKLCTVSRS